MNREQLRGCCLAKKATTEEFPFGDEVAVFKVMGKMYALLPVAGELSISLKCDPVFATFCVTPTPPSRRVITSTSSIGTASQWMAASPTTNSAK